MLVLDIVQFTIYYSSFHFQVDLVWSDHFSVLKSMECGMHCSYFLHEEHPMRILIHCYPKSLHVTTTKLNSWPFILMVTKLL